MGADALGAGVLVDHRTPHPLQEAVRADDVLGAHGRDASSGPIDIS